MKKLIPAVFVFLLLVVGSAILLPKYFARRTYTKVANRLVEVINAANYSGVESLFNKEMSQALPLEKATEFLRALSGQVGKIQKLDEPERISEGMVFPAHCERGVLDLTVTLDAEHKIAGLLFKPHVDRRYIKVANRLVELINAANYSGVESLFNKEMSQALPLAKATEFLKGLSAQAGKIQKLDEPEPISEGMVFPAHCERAVLDMTLVLDEQKKIAGLLFKPPVDRNTKVANRLVELVNAADYFGVESLFNKEMSEALPLEKAAEFLKGLSAQAGKIQKLDEPEPGSEGIVFPAHCERAVLDMTLALDEQNRIAGLVFQPHVDKYTKAANRLVELINAADYSGIENLFNRQMSKALPLSKATQFFAGMNAQFGKIQKLDEPRQNAGWTVFPAHFERGLMDMSLALDGKNKIAGFTFKPPRH
jgi:nicotinamidase-related amidase